MDPMVRLMLLFSSVACICLFALGDEKLCDSPQYAEYGESATINCAFQEDFFAIFWYNSVNVTSEDPVLVYKPFHKSGSGYISGKYDIHPNGSLIIKNVSITHDGFFSVICLKFPTDDVIPYNIQVIVIVKSLTPHPQISACQKEERICLTHDDDHLNVSCSVTNARPAVHLLWAVRTRESDQAVTSEVQISPHAISYTTLATIILDRIFDSVVLSLLVCKETNPSKALGGKESLLMIAGTRISTTGKSFVKYVEQNSNLELSCGSGGLDYFLWKFRQRSSDFYQDLSFAITIGEPFQKTLSQDYEFGINGSLLFPKPNIMNDGSYVCMFSSNLTQHIETHDVHIYVTPDPEYPAIQGCGNDRFCTIEGKTRGNITCILRGVRPIVDLEFDVTFESVSGAIKLSDNQIKSSKNDDVYDIFLTANFHGILGERAIVRCRTSGQHDVFGLKNAFQLLFISEFPSNSFSPNGDGIKKTRNGIIWIIFLPLALILTLIMIAVMWQVKRKNRTKVPVKDYVEEEQPMSAIRATDESADDLKLLFVSQLEMRYRILLGGVRPIPFKKDEFYRIEDVFVECGMEFWDSKTRSWQEMKSYHDILKVGISTLYLIEGDPGCGKSILTLRLIHDWCTQSSNSSLKDVEIVIFLRLRQLGGIQSIYKAIKDIILPKDSIITENDVERILRDCKSVVFLMDGYDEYPYEENDSVPDVLKIIKREMFQSSCIVITTRTSTTPDFLPMQITKIRLTGFDALSRKTYIEKVLTVDDAKCAGGIEKRLQEKPVIDDLCQIPLFFVLLAHMAHMSDTHWQEIKSLTEVFRYVITCLHAHFQNKLRDENVIKFKREENDHHQLDKVAFDFFFSKKSKHVMKKSELMQKIGQTVYSEYLAVGVIVEDEAFERSGNDEIYRYSSEVRFCHQIFCEWYASEYLVQNASDDEIKKVFHKIDPFRFQYVYRFACGKNSSFAEKLLENVAHDEKYEDFILLCITEVSTMSNKIISSVQELLSKNLTFHLDDTRLLQRCKVDLLKSAFEHDIIASHVVFYDCISPHPRGNLMMTSEVTFPHKLAIKEMTIYKKGQKINHDWANSILTFACHCKDMTTVRFARCIMPNTMENMTLLSTLQSRNVVVKWDPQGLARTVPHYQLNLSSGKWEDKLDNQKIAPAEYKRLTETILGYGRLIKQT